MLVSNVLECMYYAWHVLTMYAHYAEKDGQIISPFHDIPLYADAEKKIVNMVVEIPRWSNAKFEVTLR